MCRAASTLENNVAVPLEAIALKGLDNCLRGTGLLAWRVNIFDAQQPEAIIDACLKIACYRGNQRAEMKRAGRRWREPADISIRFTDTGRRCRGTVSLTFRDVLELRGSKSRQAGLQVVSDRFLRRSCRKSHRSHRRFGLERNQSYAAICVRGHVF